MGEFEEARDMMQQIWREKDMVEALEQERSLSAELAQQVIEYRKAVKRCRLALHSIMIASNAGLDHQIIQAVRRIAYAELERLETADLCMKESDMCRTKADSQEGE